MDQTNNNNMTKPPSDCSGRHIILDFWHAQHLSDLAVIEATMREAASKAGAVLLDIYLHEFSENHGITGVAILAESHISIHTWPEKNYAAFDVFMCGNSQPEKAVAHLRSVFQPQHVEMHELKRGELNQAKPVATENIR